MRRAKASWNVPIFVGAALLAVAVPVVSSFGLASPPKVLPVPIGVAFGSAAAISVALLLLDWKWQFGLLAVLTAVQIASISVGGVTVQAALIVLAPLTIRVLLFTVDEARPKWRLAEWALIAWIVLQYVSSLLFALSVTQSIGTAGLLTAGALTYFVTFIGACSRDRVVFAVRVVLAASFVGAVLALVAAGAHFAFGTTFLMGNLAGLGAVVRGIAHEPDLLGSTSAGAAITFLVLSREDNPVIRRSWALVGFWVCLGALAASLTRGATIAFLIALIAAVTLRRPAGSTRVRLLRVLAPFVGATIISVGALLVVGSAGSGGPVSQVVDQATAKVEGLTQATGSVRQRGFEIKLALGDLDHSPVLGLGSGSFGQRHIDETLKPPGPGYLGNLYVRTLYDTGIVGLALLLTFFFSTLWPSAALRRSRAELAPVAWALIFGSGALAIAYATTDGSLFLWPWILLGLVRAARELTLTQRRQLLSASSSS